MKVTPNITSLKKNEIFVFGSNSNGNHAGGAARLAVDKFGAIMGQASGMQGQSFAIQTLDKDMAKIDLATLRDDIELFAGALKLFPKKHFYLTEVGCGIAGFKPADIAPLFKSIYDSGPKNVSFPQSFIDILSVRRGYKVTNSNFSCRGFKYSLNQIFNHIGAIELCGSGFHYCPVLVDCFEYYSFDPDNRVFEIIDHGTKYIQDGGDKVVTNSIEFIRELTWLEVLTLVNTGRDNTGRRNSGSRNSGDRNSGDRNSGSSNSGDRNSGDSNSGYRNSGSSNSGDRNSGDRNSGSRNSGSSNSGSSNSGSWNSGYRNSGSSNSGSSNSGSWNSGDRNSGDSNSGSRNSGSRNSGDRNSGDSNSGYRNSGSWNSGDRNSGDSNSGYRNSGAFCTEENPKLVLFDVQTDMTVKEWEKHEAVRIMSYNLNPNIWVWSNEMTAKERKDNPTHETTGGYLKSIPYKEAWANMWGNLDDRSKKVFTTLPHFDKDKFKHITGITV